MSHLTSLFLPEPVNMYISANTFIQYATENAVPAIGLITNLDMNQRTVTIRRFMTWNELNVTLGEEVLRDITLWPKLNNNQAPFICDTDMCCIIPVELIIGIAFVFHINDPTLQQMQGMRNTYQVSSKLVRETMTIHHCKSFDSFPSTMPNSLLPTCFPSSLLKELLQIKQKVQICLSTKSLKDKYSTTCHIDNVNLLTWMYMIRNRPNNIAMQQKLVVTKTTFFEKDYYIQEKKRCKQQIIELHLPDHIPFFQSIFGTFAGVGIRKLLKSTFPKNCRDTTTRVRCANKITVHDEHNVVPFEEDCENEYVKRGVVLKYIAEQQHLTILLRYRKIISPVELLRQLEIRNITLIEDDDGDDQRIPLHSDIKVFSKAIHMINLQNRTVQFYDQSIATINDVIQEFQRLYD